MHRVPADADHDAFARTDRLVLRPWRVREADRFLDMHRRPEVADWISGQPMRERAEAVSLIERNADRLAADPRYGAWAIVERTTGVPSGSVLLKPLPDGDGEIEIGWHLHPDSWGRGLATDAARMVLRRALGDGLEEVWAVTDPANDRSIAVCLRLGLRLLGITDRWYHAADLMWWTGRDPPATPSLAPDRPAPIEVAPEPAGSDRAQRITRAYLDEVVSRYHGRPAAASELDSELARADDDGPLALLLLAAIGKTPLGCAGLRVPEPGVGEVTRVYVDPAARRLGIATRLMDVLHAHARGQRLHTLRLDTRDDLVESRALYARLGYEPTAAFNASPYVDHWLAKRLG